MVQSAFQINLRGSSRHLTDSHDSKTPDVDFGAVFFAGHYLRCHPIWRSHHSGSLCICGIGDLCTEPKVGFEANGLDPSSTWYHVNTTH